MKNRIIFLVVLILQTFALGTTIELFRASDPLVCGLPASTGEEFPWVVALEYQNKFTKENAGIRCGGSIINKRFILTAAHCIVDEEFEIIQVWLGVTNITSKEAAQKVNVEETIPHELYSSVNKLNDIGLLKLQSDLQFSDYIGPVCLPSKNSESPSIGTELTVVGWGSTENGTISSLKLKGKVPLQNNEICENYFIDRNITSKQLCVGDEKGKNPCEGDSGGPLMNEFVGLRDKVRWLQHGIVSHDTGCDLEGRPRVYTKVSSYATWIFNKMLNRKTGLDNDEPCITQDEIIGTCVPKRACHADFKLMLTKSEYYSYTKELGKYQCNGEKFDSAVCCENPGPIISVNFNTTPAALPDKKTCGILKEERGFENDWANLPWIAGIEVSSPQDNRTEIRCVGTVISSRYVITSIDCVFGEKDDTFEPINVWLGRWNSSSHNVSKLKNGCTCGRKKFQKIRIQKVIPYPFSTEWFSYNNALILLANEIQFSDYISPICLDSPNIPKLEEGSNVSTLWLKNSTRTEPITSSEMIVNQELPLTVCHNSYKQKYANDKSYYCETRKDEHNSFFVIPEAAPIMRKYEDPVSGRMQWYLVSVIYYGRGNTGSVVKFYTDSIIDNLDWIVTIISQ